jgi:hypothetical protein
MSYTCTVGINGEIPLDDQLCDELDINIGDTLIFEKLPRQNVLTARKYENQSLSDDEINASNNLSRVFALNTNKE